MKNWTVLIIVIAVLAGTLYYVFSEYQETESIQEPREIKTRSLSEVSLHDSEDDCWLLIDGKVYDVTDFIASGNHGKAILEGCGIDATTLFKQRTREDGSKVGSGTPHSPKAKNLIEDFYIGDLE